MEIPISFHLSGSALENRIDHLLDPTYSRNLLPLNITKGDYSFSGFLGNLNLIRSRPGEQYLFLNRRFIKDRLINQAIYRAYESLIKRGEFPFYVLHLNLPTSAFDINVHPTIIEARFEKKLEVSNFINNSIKMKLRDLFKVLPDIDVKSKIHKGSDPLDLGLNLNIQHIGF